MEAGQELRTYAVKNVSEWGIQVNQKLKEAIKKSPSRQKSEKEDLKAMQWWKAANNAGVDLPDSPKVWHYHPVTALKALAATGYSYGPHSISQKGIELIADFEGFRSKPYEDSAGHCTIGYGHLLHHGDCTAEDEEQYSDGITEQEGRELLKDDISEYENDVNELVEVPLRQNQFDALVSFTFNLGGEALESSTLLEKLNNRKYSEIPGELKKMDKCRWARTFWTSETERKRGNGLFRWLLVFLLVLVATNFALPQYCFSQICKDNITQIDMNKCAEKKYNKSDTTLNKIYIEILSNLKKKKRTKKCREGLDKVQK